MAEVLVRRAEKKDKATIFKWRNLEEIVLLSQSQRVVSWEEHSNWFDRALTDKTQSIYILLWEHKEIGLCRFEQGNKDCEVAIYLVPGNYGRGIGSIALTKCLTIERDNCCSFKARVRRDNERSRKFFKKHGFLEVKLEKFLVTYIKQ